MNLYVLIRVSKYARQEILWSLGIRKKRQLDDNKQNPKSKPMEVPNPKKDGTVIKTYKQDFSAQCKGFCDNGSGSEKCWKENKFKLPECQTRDCECLKCIHGKCPPAQKV